MLQSAVTVSLVPEASGGPFVFWNGLEDAFSKAAQMGFDAVEIFPPEAEALEVEKIQELCSVYRLRVAAVGTGAGWVKHRLHLCHPEGEVRTRARAFIGTLIARASRLGAPAILGSMQGRVEAGVSRAQAHDWLAEALQEAGKTAQLLGTHFLYEPLNRYETNLFNRQSDAADFLLSRAISGVRILADLFHMNIEEPDLPGALRELSRHGLLGHIHFADSNRQAMGLGHTPLAPLAEVLREIGYSGYLSAEVFPLPDSEAAAAVTLVAFRAVASGSPPPAPLPAL